MENGERVVGGRIRRVAHREEDGESFCATIFGSCVDDGLVVPGEGWGVDGKGRELTDEVETFKLVVEDSCLEGGVVEGVGGVEEVGIGVEEKFGTKDGS